MLEKLRTPRVAGISGFDFIGTLVIAFFASLLFKFKLSYSIIFFMVLAEVAHCVFKIDTPISRLLCPKRAIKK